jgi:hypothetical protein
MITKKRIRWVGHVACMGEQRKAHRILVGMPERKIRQGTPRSRWEDNIRMDLKETG